LSVPQQIAVDLLAVGKTDEETAAAVGRTRQTVSGWRKYHPDFQALLNARRHEIWGQAGDLLRSLVPRALTVLATELDSGEQKVRVALELVRLAGVRADAVGSPDPTEIVADERERRHSRHLRALNVHGDLEELRDELIAKAREEVPETDARGPR